MRYVQIFQITPQILCVNHVSISVCIQMRSIYAIRQQRQSDISKDDSEQEELLLYI